MPRILHLLSQIPSLTGSGVFFENLVRQCAAFGYQQGAVLGLPCHLKDYPVTAIAPENVFEVLFETERLPFKIPGMSDVMPYESTVFSEMDRPAIDRYSRCFTETVAEAIASFRPDIILSNHLWLATAAAAETIEGLTPKDRRPRLYAICHGTDLRQMHLCPEIKPSVVEGCQRTSGVFSLNAHQAEAIHQLYDIAPEKIHVTGTGYDSTMFYREPVLKKSGNRKIELVYAGKLARSKGLNELIQCMNLLDPDDFRLTIAGKGHGTESDEILAAIDGAGEAIRYVGQLNQSDLATLFRQSDIFVLPSYYEGLPLVVLEALASGMAVVVNDLDGLRAWLGDTVNASGQVTYVQMPKLKGVDQCEPESSVAYRDNLALAIQACGSRVKKPAAFSKDYYTAIEERSWVNVFKRMERLFLS